MVAFGVNAHAHMISLLLDFGGDVNGENQNGETPLHIAASTGNESLAKVMGILPWMVPLYGEATVSYI